MVFVDCYGEASILTKKNMIREKWVPGLEQWFPEGPETEGVCLIRVSAHRVQMWGKGGDGEYRAEK